MNAPVDHLTRRDGAVYAATHLIVDVATDRGLDCPETIEAVLRDCAKACGATLLHLHVHRFAPQGVSGVAVLAESHVSVHTWPEAGYAAFDIFLCGDTHPEAAIPVLRAAFATEDVTVTTLRRGEGIVRRLPA